MNIRSFAAPALAIALAACGGRADMIRVANAGSAALELAEPLAGACVARYQRGESLASVDRDCLPLARALSAVRAATMALRAAVALSDAGGVPLDATERIGALVAALSQLSAVMRGEPGGEQ